LLPIVKYYDHLASYISRKRPLKTKARYDFKNGRIDFKQLVKEIELKQQSAFKLYNYIYQSKELTRVVEAMTYGKNNLRNHLLVMVNLAINDYLKKKLTIKKGKITIKRKNYKGKVSLSASKREELVTAKDAEMHSSLTMNNADLREHNQLEDQEGSEHRQKKKDKKKS